MADWVGSPNPYSYVPDEFIDYTDKMNFWQRMHNTVLSTFKYVGRQLIHLPRQNAAMHKYFNYTDSLPPVWELEYKTSLVLINTHHSLSYPKPLMPNYVQVGGMHVKQPKKLPQVRNVKLIFLNYERTFNVCVFLVSKFSSACL
jgi:glucuronosyltransferase